MRFSTIHLFAAVLFCALFLQETEGARRRRKCYTRLCYKCGVFLSSRGKRSIPDGENEFDSAANLVDSATDLIDDEFDIGYHRKPNRWTERNSRQMSLMLHGIEQQDDEFDVASIFPTRIETEPKKEKSGKGRPRKRSANTHIERCRYLLRSKCCRLYNNMVQYIGYRVKRL